MATVNVGSPPSHTSPPLGWRVEEWSKACGISISFARQLIAQNVVKSVKRGRARIILTTPKEYLAEE
jgi:hypothetical protein